MADRDRTLLLIAERNWPAMLARTAVDGPGDAGNRQRFFGMSDCEAVLIHVTIVDQRLDLAHDGHCLQTHMWRASSKRTDSLYRSGPSELGSRKEPGDRCSAPVARRGVALGPSDPGLDDVVHTETAT